MKYTTEDIETGDIETGDIEKTIYSARFSPEQNKLRCLVWQVLVRNFFQQYIEVESTVLDLGSGDGHFIRNVKARRLLAIDVSPDIKNLELYGIEAIQCEATKLYKSLQTLDLAGKIDVIFMSNFIEHLPSKCAFLIVLKECYRSLSKNGRILILQPNIRYVGVSYWDYIDHHIPITEHSLVEALEISGFLIDELLPRFLPYTVKSSFGNFLDNFLGTYRKDSLTKYFIEYYLKFPFLWHFFGKQSFVVAHCNKGKDSDNKD